ncbi:YciI family protein [Actinokineospora enzanensis]|uniref:YciI family protein n=1 Tax=Actinokineospora enzanensis TaxID=155975 RepID=UPI0003757564|nr:YciI family protein [Actinokineospora enzanensis]
MRYALLINERVGAYADLDAAERAAITAEYVAFLADERVLSAERLAQADTAATVRLRDGERLVIDGPFADTKEILGGFYLVDVPDLAAALELAGRFPAVRLGGSVEVRAVVTH